jgi:hypothetical protein
MRLTFSLGGTEPTFSITPDPPPPTDGVIPHIRLNTPNLIIGADDHDNVHLRAHGWRENDDALIPCIIICDRQTLHDAMDAFFDELADADTFVSASVTGELHASDYGEVPIDQRLKMHLEAHPDDVEYFGLPVPCRTFIVHEFCECVDLDFPTVGQEQTN